MKSLRLGIEKYKVECTCEKYRTKYGLLLRTMLLMWDACKFSVLEMSTKHYAQLDSSFVHKIFNIKIKTKKERMKIVRY